MKSHIQIAKDISVERVITCGAPERAQLISTYLANPKTLSKNREYHSYVGQYQNKDILVVSHGVGASGAAICFHELMDLGVKKIIRVGTAGALRDDLEIGDIVVATAGVRKDGVGTQMVPEAFPAIADRELTHQLIVAAQKLEIKIADGIVISSDVFYPGLLDTGLELFKKAGAIAVEMECATLFIMGTLRAVRTASILGLDGNPLKWNDGVYDPSSKKLQVALEKSIQIALNAITA